MRDVRQQSFWEERRRNRAPASPQAKAAATAAGARAAKARQGTHSPVAVVLFTETDADRIEHGSPNGAGGPAGAPMFEMRPIRHSPIEYLRHDSVIC